MALMAVLPWLAITQSIAAEESAGQPAPDSKYTALAPAPKVGKQPKIQYHFGVPFADGLLKLSNNVPAKINVGCDVKRIFLLGMAEDATIRCWADPRDYSVRFFVGDDLGNIRLNYVDGTTQVYPLVLGESIWFGRTFYRFQEPFPTDAHLRKAFATALRIYPPAPVEDGNYISVIKPKPTPLQSITVECNPKKWGTPIINGVTIESANSENIEGGIDVVPGAFSRDFTQFLQEKPLREAAADEARTAAALDNLRDALYSNDKHFQADVRKKTPAGYSGPDISFKGNETAAILENAFRYNLQDISDKVDAEGMYHTSTKDATCWNGNGFGTFRTNSAMYYSTSWSRDMGRSLGELAVMEYTNEALRCADYCLRSMRLWEDNSAPKYNGQLYPPHWSRVANRPGQAPPYENDGHGLVSMFLYKLWQRLPDRDEWLRSRWPDIQAAGDWVLWEFDHPEISGATNGVLHTTGECAAGNGYSVYGDYICMEALRALAQMADSIGESQSAERWRARADKMQPAMFNQYAISDPQYGRAWTLDSAGWPGKGTVLGPLIFLADFQGFAPEDDNAAWRPVNTAAYQRLLDTYKPFGFYGQAMGYGQGFVTQSALLLDKMQDAATMLNWVAKEIYDPRFDSFIVPEGVQVDPTGRYWFRAGDLGNGVQEAEIIKTLRLVIGMDDTQPDRLRFFPRMPLGWTEMSVDRYPFLCEQGGKMQTALLRYKLERSGNRMKLHISSTKDIGPIAMRLGPFAKQPGRSSIVVNGIHPEYSAEQSGDSWWVRFVLSAVPANE
jgi:hypothetical protein